MSNPASLTFQKRSTTGKSAESTISLISYISGFEIGTLSNIHVGTTTIVCARMITTYIDKWDFSCFGCFSCRKKNEKGFLLQEYGRKKTKIGRLNDWVIFWVKSTSSVQMKLKICLVKSNWVEAFVWSNIQAWSIGRNGGLVLSTVRSCAVQPRTKQTSIRKDSKTRSQ